MAAGLVLDAGSEANYAGRMGGLKRLQALACNARALLHPRCMLGLVVLAVGGSEIRIWEQEAA